jgi:16S rRNA (guanine966-N2)-methyltransferase
MSDKMRGALFNALGDLGGLTILDPFAGSGALAFEAISRGATRAVAIDIDRSAQQTIADNIAALGLRGRVKLVRASAHAWLSTTDELFDVIVCDPPYNDLQNLLLVKLAQRIKVDGLVVLSLPPTAAVHLPANFEHLTTKTYGDAQLIFYRKSSQLVE